MGFEGVLDLDAGVPDFQSSIPSDSGEVRGVRLGLGGRLHLRRVGDFGNPVAVIQVINLVVHSQVVFLQRFTDEFAVSQSIPESDISVSTG